MHHSPGVPKSQELRALGDYSSFRDSIQGTLMLLGTRKAPKISTSHETVRNQDLALYQAGQELPVRQLVPLPAQGSDLPRNIREKHQVLWNLCCGHSEDSDPRSFARRKHYRNAWPSLTTSRRAWLATEPTL